MWLHPFFKSVFETKKNSSQRKMGKAKNHALAHYIRDEQQFVCSSVSTVGYYEKRF